MHFEFATAGRILFGPGAVHELVPAIAGLGRRCLLVTSRSCPAIRGLPEQLSAAGVTPTPLQVTGEPTVPMVESAVAQARAAECGIVVAVGGGSVLDTGKAVAALLTNGGSPLDYLEVIGKGQAINRPAAPFVAVPTTAGTGTEVTRNAVLGSPAHRVKVSLRSPFMLPRLAIVDPDLTRSLPPAVTAASGLDALTQLIEPLVCSAPNPLVDALCRDGIVRAARALPRAYHDGADRAAREDMSLAALMSGLALANARLGAVHGLAGVLGGVLGAPHGAICARLLPFVTETNLDALRARAPESPALTRYAEVARLLTGRQDAKAEDGAAWLHALCAELDIPPLARYGLTSAAIPAIVPQAQKASSMKGNPLPLTDAELTTILERAL